MATRYFPLPILAWYPPDGSTGNIPAAVAISKSSASAPSPHHPKGLFDAATDEALEIAFAVPGDYVGSPVLTLLCAMASATSGNVVMQAYVSAVTAADAQDLDANGYDSVNASSATAVAGTAGHVFSVSITLTNADSLAAGDDVVLRVGRDADNGSDTATGDLELLNVSLQYSDT